MKKMISMVLCLAFVFSVCSFTLTANAAIYPQSFTQRYSVCNNSFTVDITSWFNTNQGITGFLVSVIDNKTSTDKNDLQYIFDEFIPNCDYLEKLGNTYDTDFSSTYTIENFVYPKVESVYFSVALDVEDANTFGILNEDNISYILSRINSPVLRTINISSDTVTDMSPIVDFLLENNKNTLENFTLYSNSVTEIDSRLFSEFPNNTNLFGGENLWSLASDSKIDYIKDRYSSFYNSYVGGTFYFYDVPNLIWGTPDAGLFEGHSVRAKYQDFLEDLENDIVIAGEDLNVWVQTDYEESGMDSWYYDELIATISIHCTCAGKSCLLGQYEVYCLAYGDTTLDGYVDAFDVAMTTEYVNTFEEPEEISVKGTMDVVRDGYIDATDLAYVSYIANFEG